MLPAQSATRQVKGIIKDDKGAPASSVTVTVKNTNRSKVSASDGTFSINAAEGDALVLTSVSYNNVEIPVTKENFYSVLLNESVARLGEVVVVGYGKSTRKTLTSAVSSIKAEDFNRGAISDVGQLLQGKVPGLNISASGDPNRTAAVIIRGASTLNSSQGPFYVIDGIPGADISAVAPDDIASIDVLKDAAATAIYGNRAANGVIMVTTKRGRKGQSLVTYSGYAGIEKVSNQLKMLNAEEAKAFLGKNNLAFSPNDDKGANTNWQDAVQNSAAIS